MNFLIVSCICGIILTVAPFWAGRILRARWKMPRGLFVKAGLALLIIEIIHLAVVGNAVSIWPQILDWPLPLRALALGAAAGLFIELGRFLVLDKMMKGVRTEFEGVYFALGWSGLLTALLGILIVIGVFGMQTMVANPDLAARFPEASKADIERIQVFQKQAVDLMQGNPLVGLTPLLERGSMLMIDITLTLLILLGLFRGLTSYIWAAVGLRAVFSGALIFAGNLNVYAGEAVYLVAGILAFLLARQLENALTIPGVHERTHK